PPAREDAHDSPRRDRDLSGFARRPRRGPGGYPGGRGGSSALARRPRARRRGRGNPARRLLLRGLPAVRRDRAVRPDHGGPGARRPGGPAGAGDLQRVPDPVRGAPAARRAGPQQRAAVHRPPPAGADRGHRHAVDARLHRRPGGHAGPEERRGRLPGRPGGPGPAGGAGAGGGQVPRRKPERLRAGYRRDQERGGQRGRAHAPPRARDRPADRAGPRRAGLLHLGPAPGGGGPMSADGAGRMSADGGGRMSADGAGVASVGEDGRAGGAAAELDTVARAAATGDRPQPYAELGLTDDEYQRIRRLLGRRPSDCELAIYSVMWSEHCSYKSSRRHLRQLADQAPPSGALLAGLAQNAGVVDIGQGYAVTFKIESHNHPSYVEPFQGAATGVGGIVRDILAMGARPVAVMDALRFGPAGAPDTARVLPGVVGGI